MNVQPWARVLVDGVERASSTPAAIPLPPGMHLVTLVHGPPGGPSCCAPLEEEVQIESGKVASLRRRLEPLDAQLVVHGPPETRVWLDGVESTVGATGGSFPVPMKKDAAGAPLYQRRVQVRVAVPGKEEILRELELRAGEEKPLELP